MGGMAGFAAKLRAVHDRAESDLAIEAARMSSREYLAILHEVTPVRTGALRGSEHVWSVSGGGDHAQATAGPDIIYDKFRNDGGTIRRKAPPPAVLGTPATGFFGRVVHQKGAHYMEKARAASGPVIEQACKVVADEILEL